MSSSCFIVPSVEQGAQEIDHGLFEKVAFIYGSLETHLSTAMSIEDNYLKMGVLYHSTQMRARNSSHFPQDKLTMLAQMFEISTVAEYTALFAGIQETIAALTDISSSYARTYGSPNHLNRFMELEPRWTAVFTDFVPVARRFLDAFEDAQRLYDISRASCEADGDGVRFAWHDPTDSDSPLHIAVPVDMGEEWSKFRAWVSILPETLRSISQGRTLDQIAMGLLFVEDEGFEGDAEEFAEDYWGDLLTIIGRRSMRSLNILATGCRYCIVSARVELVSIWVSHVAGPLS
jgi:hypothetical protein